MKVSAHPTLRWQDIGYRRPEWATLAGGGPTFHYTYNARGALYQLLRAMPQPGRRTLLLPAFHCPTVVEPALRAGWSVRFYRIRQDLSLDLEDLQRQLSTDVGTILVIHFLGFPTPLDDLLVLRQQFGFYLIEDWAHSFLLGPELHVPGELGDFALLSFYKHVPSFAGGALRVNAPISWSPAPDGSVGWRQTAVIAKRLLEQAIDNSNGGPLKAIFQSLEKWRVESFRQQSPEGRSLEKPVPQTSYEFSEQLAKASVPWLSRKILEAGSWKSIFETRRRNYVFLAEHLEDNPLFRAVHPSLPAEVCPWAFPVWLPLRSEHDRLLRAQGVPLFTFGEILHPIVDQAPETSREDARHLSQHLLLLSVHQNLELADMERTTRLVNDFYKGRD